MTETPVTEVPTSSPAVSSYNEWDPLVEVIVGHVEHAMTPPWDAMTRATMPKSSLDFFRERGARPFPEEAVSAARAEIEEFVHVLEAEGVTVRRPAVVDFSRPYATPEWACEAGLYAAMPRDVLLVFGDEIIEVPMAWRCRHHELAAYRPLLKEYFRRGARWASAPRPELRDELYDGDLREAGSGTEMRYVVTEDEPTFDAADFVRCGRDVFAQKSHVTNELGIAWLRRHLGEDYRVHVLEFDDSSPMHIDASFMPLAPGKVLVNPDRVRRLPEAFRSWDVLEAPRPCRHGESSYRMCSDWISMNVLMLDPERVVVERNEEPLVRALRDWGFEPVRCSFERFNVFGGGFHCCTLDVRRRGTLESYF